MIFLTITCIILAGFFKAVADTLQHHFDSSIFKTGERKFWDPIISWKYAGYLKFTRYRLDGWHLANSGMIIAFCVAVVCYQSTWSWYIELLAAGLLFNLSFNLFYNRILR